MLTLVLSFRVFGRRMPGTRTFTLLLLTVGAWCFLYAAEIAAPWEQVKLALASVEYFFIALVPLLWLAFSMRHTGQEDLIRRSVFLLLCAVPFVMAGLAATNRYHGLVWSSVEMVRMGNLQVLRLTHGSVFWTFIIYSYAALLMGAGILISSTMRHPRAYRRHSLFIVGALAAPWLTNALYSADIAPYGWLDLTPFVFAFSSAFLVFALARTRLLDLFLGLQTRARSAIIEAMPDALIVLDGDERVIDHNMAATRILGCATREGLQTKVLELLERHGVHSGAEVDCNHLYGELEADLPDGRRTLDLLVTPLSSSDRGRAARLVLLRDITEIKQAEKAVTDSRKRYQALVENAHDLIFTVDAEGRLTSLNPAVESVTGYSRTELLGRSINEFAQEDGLLAVQDLPLLDQGATRQEIALRSKSGRVLVLEASVRAELIDGRPSGYQYIARDVTESRQWEEALKFHALHDTVTSLPNRACFRDTVTERINVARSDNVRFALCILDLDHFKYINDSLGHHMGDRVLEVAARRLGNSLRTTDFLARLGGDEFGLIVAVDDVEDARYAAARVLNVLTGPCQIEGKELNLTASLGVAVFPDHGTTVDGLQQMADFAMYSAKQAGGARHAVCDENDGARKAERLTFRTELLEAFHRGDLSLYYQPLVGIGDGAHRYFEALVRWNHPRRGLILPNEFVGILEQDGLGEHLGRWALDRALEQCAKWRARGFTTRVSVNLTAHDLQDLNLVSVVETALADHGAEPDWLMVELTEGNIMHDPETSVQTLVGIRELGVSVAIDDFGAGQTSLPYLKNLPADVLKIDRAFVTNMTLDKHDAAIVRSTIGLAHELGLRVVAEGIEDEATLRLLRAYGCDVGQGFYLGRPQAARSISWGLRSNSWDQTPYAPIA